MRISRGIALDPILSLISESVQFRTVAGIVNRLVFALVEYALIPKPTRDSTTFRPEVIGSRTRPNDIPPIAQGFPGGQHPLGFVMK